MCRRLGQIICYLLFALLFVFFLSGFVSLSSRVGAKLLRTDMRTDVKSDIRNTIQNIKEIAKTHSEDDIYAMMKECNMDPHETVQKLLSQDPFHEVRSKREKRKENVGGRDAVHGRLRSGNHSQGGRRDAFFGRGAGRVSYRPCYISRDAGSGNGSNMGRENSRTRSLPTSACGISTASGGHFTLDQPLCALQGDHIAATGETTMTFVKATNVAELPALSEMTVVTSTSAAVQGQTPKSQQPIALTPISPSRVHSWIPNPVYVPYLDCKNSDVVGTIKCEVGTVGVQRCMADQSTASLEADHNSVSSIVSETLQLAQSSPCNVIDSKVKLPGNNKSDLAIVNPLSSDQHSNNTKTSNGDHMSEMKSQGRNFATSGTSSNKSSAMGNPYSSRPQQLSIGHQKVGPIMEWKPKPSKQNVASNPGVIGTYTISNNTSEIKRLSQPSSDSRNSEEEATKLQEKLEHLNVRVDQQLIMPDNLRVSEAACTGISFGSFGAFFQTTLSTGFGNSDSDKSSTPLPEASHRTEESIEEPSARMANSVAETPGEDHSQQQQTSASSIENLATTEITDSIAPSAVFQSDPPNRDPVVQLDLQYSIVQPGPSYMSAGLMPQITGSEYLSYESSLSNPVDAFQSRSFLMQQACDPSTSYLSPFFRPGCNGDTRFSSFVEPAASTKYNENFALSLGQTVSLAQEMGNLVVRPTTGHTAVGLQTPRIPQTTISLPPQQMHVFPQPASVHISSFPPGYFPYPHQCFSPLYFSPPAIHNFSGNIGYPQPSTDTNYFPPPGTLHHPAAAAIKYPLSLYKPMTAGGNSSQAAFPVGYTNHTAAASGFSVSPVVTAGSGTAFDENRETNLYIPGQQADSPTFWIRAPLQNVSSSHYNLSVQAQRAAFAATPPGHAAYAGLYHHAQPGLPPNSLQLLQQSETLRGATGVTGAQPGVYQQSQQGQLNWTNNY